MLEMQQSCNEHVL